MSLSSLRLDFIYDLFEKVGSRNSEEKMGTARRKPTVSSQFRVSDTCWLINRWFNHCDRLMYCCDVISHPQDSLHALMATLSVSNPFFIRCIKPNMEKVCLVLRRCQLSNLSDRLINSK